MIELLFQFLVDVAKGIAIGVPSFIVGFFVYSKYIAPKQTAEMGAKTAEQLFKNPKIKNSLDKLQSIDVQELIDDYKKFMGHLDEVDWKALAETLKTIRVAVEVYTNANNEHRQIPAPD